MRKINTALLLAAGLLLGGAGYSQTDPHSGILHVTSDTEEFNLIKIHCDELADATIADVIQKEFEKYPEQIASVDINPATLKIYVKYRNTIEANTLLGILERVAISAYYLDTQNNPVTYTKTGHENFRR